MRTSLNLLITIFVFSLSGYASDRTTRFDEAAQFLDYVSGSETPSQTIFEVFTDRDKSSLEPRWFNDRQI
jgi:hypothetical protein